KDHDEKGHHDCNNGKPFHIKYSLNGIGGNHSERWLIGRREEELGNAAHEQDGQERASQQSSQADNETLQHKCTKNMLLCRPTAAQGSDNGGLPLNEHV